MDNKWQAASTRIQQLVGEHEAYRRNSLNLIAAESRTSLQVERIIGSDLSRRYSSPGVYAGDKFFLPAYQLTIELLQQLFRAEYVSIRPATGNLAVLAILTGLTKPGDTLMKVGDSHGGYPIRLAGWSGVHIVPFPFDFDRLNIRTEEAADLVRRVRPALVIFGASEFLYPHPVGPIASAAHDVGAVVAYDGSHVMGLIAGGEFQDPLREGADVLYGSTHKTFPGPQRGMIATNDRSLMERISEVLMPPPFLLSCFHINTVVALGVAAAEMLAHGRPYATQIVRNSQALARGLLAAGVPVFTAAHGATRSHQVILDNGGFVSPEGIRIKEVLERCGILADAVVRIGTQEVTRLGMREEQMACVGALIGDAIYARRPEAAIRDQVTDLAREFTQLQFCLDDECAAQDVVVAGPAGEMPRGRRSSTGASLRCGRLWSAPGSGAQCCTGQVTCSTYSTGCRLPGQPRS